MGGHSLYKLCFSGIMFGILSAHLVVIYQESKDKHLSRHSNSLELTDLHTSTLLGYGDGSASNEDWVEVPLEELTQLIKPDNSLKDPLENLDDYSMSMDQMPENLLDPSLPEYSDIDLMLNEKIDEIQRT